MARKLTIKQRKTPAMTVDRGALRGGSKLVYIICTPKPMKYPQKRSRIVYIGTTAQGVHRMASSMAHKAIDYLAQRGVSRLDVHLVSCPPRPGLKSWLHLERDLLITFKLVYGQIPTGNRTGKNFTPGALSGRFQWSRLLKVLKFYE
jgi:hypothetical protein